MKPILRLNATRLPQALSQMEPANTLTPQASDDEKRQALRRMKRFATSMMLIAVVIFLYAYQQTGYVWGLIAAAAEASMIGGLADWFAVTALFRHPLGLPIPHTAIIHKQKDRIGGALGNFVYKHFLTPDLIRQKLAQLNPAEKIGAWLSEPANSQKALHAISQNLPTLLDRLNDDQVRRFVRENITNELMKVDLAPKIGRLLDALSETDRYNEVLDFLLLHTAQGLDRNKEKIEGWIDENLKWYKGLILKQFVKNVPGELLKIMEDDQHRFRTQLGIALRALADDLQENPEWQLKIADLKQQVLQHEVVREYMENIWSTLKASIREDLSRPDSRIQQRLQDGSIRLGQAILRDTEIQATLNRNLDEMLTNLVVTRGEEVAVFIADTVRKWDAETMVDRVEINIGRDLQFVRINGTLIGGLIGALLYVIRTFLTGTHL